jgi:hypothetical protein
MDNTDSMEPVEKPDDSIRDKVFRALGVVAVIAVFLVVTLLTCGIAEGEYGGPR